MAWIFFFTSSISPGLCIPFLPSGRHLPLFPFTRWKSLSTLLLPFGLSLSPPTYQSCLNASFYPVYSSFWNLNSILSRRQAGFRPERSTLDQILYLSQPIPNGLNKPRPGSRTILSTIDFSKAFDSVWHPCLFHKLISIVAKQGLTPCFARWTQSFLSEWRACVVSQNHKSRFFFESVEVFRKDPFLALYFSLSSSMIFWPLCLLPSAAVFTLTIWPFGPPHPRFPLRWRPHKEVCFGWSAGLSTGVFLSIRGNM